MLAGWLTEGLAVRLAAWLAGVLAGSLAAGWLACWGGRWLPAGWLAGRGTGCADWQAGRLAGLWCGRLATGWLAGSGCLHACGPGCPLDGWTGWIRSERRNELAAWVVSGSVSTQIAALIWSVKTV